MKLGILDIGKFIKTGVICGRYGFVGLTTRGYFVCDACYIPDAATVSLIGEAHLNDCPWFFRDRDAAYNWHLFSFNGFECAAKASGDGPGPFGFGVDSGCTVAVPLKAIRLDVAYKLLSSEIV